MKATLFVHHFNNDQATLIAAKLDQWVEFLRAAGIEASFLVRANDPPAADLWQAAQAKTIDEVDPHSFLLVDEPREEDYEVCSECSGLQYLQKPYEGTFTGIEIDIFEPCPTCNTNEQIPYYIHNKNGYRAREAQHKALGRWLESIEPQAENDKEIAQLIDLIAYYKSEGSLEWELIERLERLSNSEFTFRMRRPDTDLETIIARPREYEVCPTCKNIEDHSVGCPTCGGSGYV
jgi:hypothetical protein